MLKLKRKEANLASEECRLLGCFAVWLFLRTDVSDELSASIVFFVACICC
jgi:hypothetical protein